MSYDPNDALYEALGRAGDAGIVARWPADDEAWVRFGNASELIAWTRSRVYTLRNGSVAFGDVWTSRGRCRPGCGGGAGGVPREQEADVSEWDDVTGCFQCDLYVSEHDPETLAAHQAATDAELDEWEAQVVARANATEAASRVRHLRSVRPGGAGTTGG